MSKKYVITEETIGVLLGMSNNMLIFAKHNPFGLDTAVTLPTKEVCESYIKLFLDSGSEHQFGAREFKIFEVNSAGSYATLSELIKSGLEKYTHNMLLNVGPVSAEVH